MRVGGGDVGAVGACCVDGVRDQGGWEGGGGGEMEGYREEGEEER